MYIGYGEDGDGLWWCRAMKTARIVTKVVKVIELELGMEMEMGIEMVMVMAM